MKKRDNWQLNLIAGGTLLVGLVTISSTLFALVHIHRARIVLADAHFSVIAGVSLIYLAGLLRRGKSNAWLVSVVVYLFLLARNFHHFVFNDDLSRHYIAVIFSNLLLPAFLLILLIVFRQKFRVKSEPTTFRIAARRALLILLVAFLYGVVGFQLFDDRDFHQNISLTQAAHYTIDQFGLTTNNKPVTYTKRSVLFVDSLASASIASLAYVAIAFFAPVRWRFYHHERDYQDARSLVWSKPKTSEDFFKLWPRDKVYLFNSERSAMLAYKVAAGVAMVVGDPLGSKPTARSLSEHFLEICHINDWSPAFIHTDTSNLKLYEEFGLEAQKIGEEALVEVAEFNSRVAHNKYFRNIKNRFTKIHYSFETLSPPHSQDLLQQLGRISSEWLELPGRAERGFMMGYFNEAYLQQCDIAIVKDAHGQIMAFLNQVPSCLPDEANYDFLRSRSESPPNINDFLMINFFEHLALLNYKTLNMGLCPLAGLDKAQNKGLVGNLLRFAYENGGRFYSFEGLTRFKAKYEPKWQDRYIVYSGGPPGFGKTMAALLRAMTSHPKPGANKR